MHAVHIPFSIASLCVVEALGIKNSPHALYLTVQAQVREVEAAKERRAVRVKTLTNRNQGLEGRVRQLHSEKERERVQVQQLQVCSARSIQCFLFAYHCRFVEVFGITSCHQFNHCAGTRSRSRGSQ